MITFAIALAGGVGAMARFSVDALLPPRGPIPWSTLLVNLTGSLLLGSIAGSGNLPPEWGKVLTIGLLGGYTTFSTAAVQAAELLLGGERGVGIGYAAGTLIGAVAVSAIGLCAGGIGATLLLGTGAMGIGFLR